MSSCAASLRSAIKQATVAFGDRFRVAEVVLLSLSNRGERISQASNGHRDQAP
jgi:hypothetical protein